MRLGCGQLKSTIPHRNLGHLGSRARLPHGAVSGCAETSTWPGGYFGENQHLTQSEELIVLSFKPRFPAGAFPFGVVAFALVRHAPHGGRRPRANRDRA
jgi:hypothetical protein